MELDNHMDNKEMSKIIEESTCQIIEQTEEFIESVKDNVLGDNTVKILLNGSEVKLNRIDYDELKSRNEKIRTQMKTQIKVVVDKTKDDIKKK